MQTVGITTAEFATSGLDKLRAHPQSRQRGCGHPTRTPRSREQCRQGVQPSRCAQQASGPQVVGVRYWSEGKPDRPAMDEMVRGLAIIGEIEGK